MGERGGRSRGGRSSEGTRTRILDAARELAVDEGFSGFTVEGVAARAGVSRMTVYYQFGSKQDLLESLFDHLASRGRMDRLAEAFRSTDPLEALDRFIDTFCGFWASDRIGLRRLRGWASVESDREEPGLSRDAWRRGGLEAIVGRIRAEHAVPAEHEVDEVVDLLHALTSFESYDVLARGSRTAGDVAALLQRSARAILGIGEPTS
jgi:AcrR family transcriptional regulator